MPTNSLPRFLAPAARTMAVVASACLAGAAPAGAQVGPRPGTIWTVAGDGMAALAGDGLPGWTARINHPQGVVGDGHGGFVIADNFNHLVRRVDAGGTMSTIAGTGQQGYGGDGSPGPGGDVKLNYPRGVDMLADGSILIADTNNSVIRKLGPDGTITTVAGTGTAGYSGDGRAATSAQLCYAGDIAPTADGGFLIADTCNNVVRKVFPDGSIVTVAGDGTPGDGPDNERAPDSRLNQLQGVAATPDGGYVIADKDNNKIRKVSPKGIITTLAGKGPDHAGFGGDGGPARDALLDHPQGVGVAADGSVLIADTGNNRVRVVGLDGRITTVAGDGTRGYAGDGGPAVAAQLAGPYAVSELPGGDLLIADEGNHRIRRVAGPASAPAASRASVYVSLADANVALQFSAASGGRLTPTIPFAVPAGTPGGAIAATPDGKHVYLITGASAINEYDVSDAGILVPKRPSSVAAASASALAVSPDGGALYATSYAGGQVLRFDIGADGSLTTAGSVATEGGPVGVVLSPDGDSAYVANRFGQSITQYDVAADGSLHLKSPAAVSTPLNPQHMAISPDGRSLYATNPNVYGGGSTMLQFDIAGDGTLSPKTPAAVTTGRDPSNVAITPDGRHVYVTNRGNNAGNTLYQYGVGAGGRLALKPRPAVATGAGPGRIAISPDGASVYVADGGVTIANGATSAIPANTVSQFDVLPDGQLAAKDPARVSTSRNPAAVLVLPDQGPRAAIDAAPAAAGSASRFDGSHSVDTDGRVARYDWTFGDGTVVSDGGPSPSHTYATPGTYAVTLTVTDDAGCSLAQVFTGTTAYCNGSAAARTTRSIVVPAAQEVGPPVATVVPQAAPAGLARGTFALRVGRVAATAAGDVTFTVTDTTGSGGEIAIAGAEARLGSRARPSPYRALQVMLAPNGSRTITLRAPASVRAALHRALRNHSRVVRRPSITITRVATGGTRMLKPAVVQRRAGARR